MRLATVDIASASTMLRAAVLEGPRPAAPGPVTSERIAVDDGGANQQAVNQPGDVSSVPAETVKDTAQAMTAFMRSMDSHLAFKVHDETGILTVKIVNNESGEVIKEVPPKELLETSARIREMIGVFLDKKS